MKGSKQFLLHRIYCRQQLINALKAWIYILVILTAVPLWYNKKGKINFITICSC